MSYDKKEDYNNIFFHARNNAVCDNAMSYIRMIMKNEKMHDVDKFAEIRKVIDVAVKYLETKTEKEKVWDNLTNNDDMHNLGGKLMYYK